eukprot:3589792-Prymnesium_polylepis.2
MAPHRGSERSGLGACAASASPPSHRPRATPRPEATCRTRPSPSIATGVQATRGTKGSVHSELAAKQIENYKRVA